MNVATTISNDTPYYGDEAATLGDRIVAAREAVGYSQKKLASRLGVKLKTVQGWEEDRTEPRANKAQMISGILGVSLVWLLSGEGEGVLEPADTPSGSEDIQGILDEIRTLRTDMAQTTRRLSTVEKRLRARL
ncbi:helix-turn-helix transcriptional regulator [Ruegeria sp. R13_0]|uniref:helix-turn-helix domain-containing protein n=1 Tax=Ruegeria sp. R13_0 TaxID=2821099 RepID=UPI001ADB59B2|nr:helix-turn-helix transcriptional regulator [Ruegeria sp. R13_0]MBO9437023.1 helix-turn-helix transcriptional regulator [Ruegeria sp. R13_0]